MFTTTISLPTEIHRELKHRAVDEAVTFRDIIRRAIEEYLRKGGDSR